MMMLVLVLSLREDMINNHCDSKHKCRVRAGLYMHNVFVRDALQIFLDSVAVITRDARNFLVTRE